MEPKKFKDIRNLGKSLSVYQVDEYRVEIKRVGDSFVLFIDGVQIESFNTENAAKEAAAYAVDTLGTVKE